MAVSRMGWWSIGGAAVVAVLAGAGLMGGGAARTVAAGGSTVTTVEGDTVGAGDYSRAVCPDGTQLVGGGYEAESKYTDGGAYADSVDLNAPLHGGVWRAQSHKGWIKAMRCATVLPLRPGWR